MARFIEIENTIVNTEAIQSVRCCEWIRRYAVFVDGVGTESPILEIYCNTESEAKEKYNNLKNLLIDRTNEPYM